MLTTYDLFEVVSWKRQVVEVGDISSSASPPLQYQVDHLYLDPYHAHVDVGQPFGYPGFFVQLHVV